MLICKIVQDRARSCKIAQDRRPTASRLALELELAEESALDLGLGSCLSHFTGCRTFTARPPARRLEQIIQRFAP